ncbi:MAG: nucleotidyltransferase domain-containing protein [Armatimonadota bacterium]|nr:nucleotidyltransferase domain-containing protein [Armatimonadota bacterium]MDR7534412.1 nucleotidyltransferase domain-containing protein [Armatimonadota bacterium]
MLVYAPGPSDSSHGDLNRALRAVAQLYVDALRESLGPALVSAVLFGSVARGEAGPVSDIDLLVVAEGLPSSRLARQDAVHEADARIEPELVRLRRQGVLTDVRPILKTPEEAQRITPLYLDMVEDADLLYDRDEFFANVLRRLRDRLQALGARRVRRGRMWYWDLKPDFRPGQVFEL